MRYLIDGYNLMYAGGLLGKRLGPDGFRKVRTRFLNDLAAALGALDAHVTTVVFDAAGGGAEGFPAETRHKGISVVFAVDDESADERIERLISAHSSPRTLTVVSTDHRLRQAATRRKALAQTADEFWVQLDARKRRKPPEAPPPPPDRPRDAALSAEESAYWLRQFGDLDQSPETREALNNDPPLLSDEEIAELQREIEASDDD